MDDTHSRYDIVEYTCVIAPLMDKYHKGAGLTQSHAFLEAALTDPTPAGPQRWKRLVRK